MRTITVHVSEPVYHEFQDFARSTQRKTAELIREAMKLFSEQKIHGGGHSLRDHMPVSAGKLKRRLVSREDMTADMMDGRG